MRFIGVLLALLVASHAYAATHKKSVKSCSDLTVAEFVARVSKDEKSDFGSIKLTDKMLSAAVELANTVKPGAVSGVDGASFVAGKGMIVLVFTKGDKICTASPIPMHIVAAIVAADPES